MKKQVVVIHGGDAFAEDEYEKYLQSLRDYKLTYEDLLLSHSKWKDNLKNNLEDYDVLYPEMPNAFNARFKEWALWFEKLFPMLRDGVILLGHSLGGSFLAKYLSEKSFPHKIAGVFLVAACYDKDTTGNGLHTFAMPKQLNIQADRIFLYHSKDDPFVPFSDLALFQKQLPDTTVREFSDRGHFHQKEFPEIVEDIKSL